MATHNLRAPNREKPLSRRILDRKDVLAGLLFMSVAILGLWVSRDYPIGTALRMSTGYVPRLLCWALLLLGCTILLSGVRAADEDCEPDPVASSRALILVPAAVAAFALTLERFGLVVACALLIGIGSLANRGLRPVEAIATGIFLTLMIWAIFVSALGLTIRVWPEF